MDESSSQTSKWIKTLGLGALGGFAIAFAWSLIAFWSEMPAGEEAAAPTTDAETAAPAAEGPTDLRAHQQHVSDVLADLNRDVLVASSPTRGNPHADIVMLKFSDFQCPFCAQATTEVETFLADAKDEVLFVYKHLPLIQSHPEAVPAAQAAWAAQQQGQFWPYHDALFARQGELGEDLYVAIAQELNLDLEQFNRDRASEGANAAIAQDLALSQELRLTSTPTFLMGELLLPGAIPADLFAEALIRLKAFDDAQP
jgi:protein-disulfide isomerase